MAETADPARPGRWPSAADRTPTTWRCGCFVGAVMGALQEALLPLGRARPAGRSGRARQPHPRHAQGRPGHADEAPSAPPGCPHRPSPVSSSARVSSRRQTPSTSAVGRVTGEVAADVRRRAARPRSGRSLQQRHLVAARRAHRDHRTRAPCPAAPPGAARGSPGRPSGPTTATSRGPSSSASATASPQPMNRGARGAERLAPRPAPARRPCGGGRCRCARRSDSSAPAAAVQPEGAALSVGSCGRRISCSASCGGVVQRAVLGGELVAARCPAGSPANSSHTPSPVTAASARKPSATSA